MSIDPRGLRRPSVAVALTSAGVVLLLSACGGAAAPTVSGPAPTAAATGAGAGAGATPTADATSEKIGGIGLGDSIEAVTAAFGPPARKGAAEEWAASGEFVAAWEWPDRGLKLDMAAGSADGEPRVGGITVSAPSQLTTSRGVGLGATRAEVEKVYAAFRTVGREPGEPDPSSVDTLVIGSVYGGTFFSFTDGKLTGIFVGAGAE